MNVPSKPIPGKFYAIMGSIFAKHLNTNQIRCLFFNKFSLYSTILYIMNACIKFVRKCLSASALILWLYTSAYSQQQINFLQRSGKALSGEISKNLSKGLLLNPDKLASKKIYDEEPESFLINIPLYGGEQKTFIFYKKHLTTSNFKVTTSDGKTFRGKSAIGVHYQIDPKAGEEKVGGLSFTGDEVSGMFSDDFGNWNIGKLPGGNGQYVVYCERDLNVSSDFQCVTQDIDGEKDLHIEKGFVIEKSISTTGTCKEVNVYFECDFKMYQDNGSSVTNVSTKVAGMFNVVKQIYGNEQIDVNLSEIFVWTTTDPYATLTNAQFYLINFSGNRPTINGNLGHLLSTRTNSFGGIAWIGGLCNPGGKYAFSNIYNSFSALPTYSWTVNVIAHEMGHNMGSQHTHWCGWQLTPTTKGRIDSCAAGEPFAGSVNCSNTTKFKTNGTVMSYCHNLGAINLNLGFGPLPGNAIRNSFNNAICLSGAPVPKFTVAGTRIACEGENINLNLTTPVSGGTYSWTGPNGFVSSSQNPSIPGATSLATGTYTATLSKSGCTSDAKTIPVVVNGLNAPPINETFEGTFLPPNWRISNPNNDRTFVKNATVGGFGTSSGSVAFDNYSLPFINGRIDTLYVPAVNLGGLSGASLSFDLAYAWNGATNDTLVVAVSTNCGKSFTRLFSKTKNVLATAPNKSTAFAPTNSQWRKETIDLTAYNGLSGVQICFINISGSSNLLFLDNINMTTSGGGGPSISLNPLAQSAFCPGANFSVGFTPAGTFNSGNSYTVQLSNSSGGFASPVSIGSGAGSPITVTIPGGTNSGTGYLIRVISSNPVVNSAPGSGINISPLSVVAGSDFNICSAASPNNLIATPTGGTWTGNGVTSAGVFTPSSLLVGTQTLTYSVSSGGCSGSDQRTIIVNASPSASAGTNNSTCSGSSAFSLAGFSPAGGSWTGNGVNTTGIFTPATSLVGTQTLTYSVTSNGCSSTANKSVTVNASPTVSAGSNQNICSNTTDINLTGSPAGGTWTGSGVTTTGLFSLTNGVIGGNTLTYTIVGTCSGSSQKIVTILEAPFVDAGPGLSFCNSSSPVSVTQGSPAGGSWSGSGFSGGMFNPATAGLGTLPLTYAVTQNGCSASSSVDFTVNPSPAPVLIGNQNPCSGGGAYNLSASPSGGTWSGNGVSSGGNFIPSTSNIGANAITYTVTQNGCTGTSNLIITVKNTPTAQAGSDKSATLISGSIQLTGSPVGGSWTGTGVSNSGLFSPSGAGQGSFTLVYSFSQNGCTDSDELIFTVLPTAAVTAGGDVSVCESAPEITLVGNPSGGTWSGNGVTSAGIFTPDSSLIGSQTLTYTVAGNGSDEIIVIVTSTPNISLPATSDVCGSLTEYTMASPGIGGGTWSGTGISAAGLVTVSLLSTSGNTFSYSINQNGCIASAQLIAIKVNPPVVNAGANLNICKNANSVQLVGIPTGGTWSGSGVNGSGIFNPASVSNGAKTITYLVESALPGCSGSNQTVVTVVNIPNVSAGVNRTTCSNSQAFSVSGTPAGGLWSGTGVNSSGLFTPTVALTGIQSLTYTASQNGCSNSATTNITVNSVPDVSAGSNQNICTNDPSFALTGENPSGGTWSGASFVNASGQCTAPFSAGNYNLMYTATQNGCAASAQITFAVSAIPNVNAGSNKTTCSNSNSLNLTGFSPAGGVWSGNGVSSSGVFSPSTSLAGNQNLTYSVTQNGCVASKQITVTVKSIPSITTGANEAACESGVSFKINGYSPRGGKWTGPGIFQDSLYQPSNSLIGLQTLTYSITKNGCTNTAQKTMTVSTGNAITQGIFPTRICSNGSPTNFTGFLPAGGVWSGPGMSSSGMLSPNNSIIGLQSYTYKLNSNGCRDSIQVQSEVNAVPVANAGSDIAVCASGAAVVLNNANPVGGIWSGPGVNAGGTFNPALVSAGITALSYSYTSNGCTATDNVNVNVSASPTVTAGNDRNICKNSIPVTLTGAPFGGTWAGTGVSSTGVFTSASNMSGNITLTYTINENGCTGTDQVIVSITNAVNVNAGASQTICTNISTFNLTGASPSGGSWSGIGVSPTGSFNPNGLLAGAVSLNYRVTQGNCTVVGAKNITINEAPVAVAGSDLSVCSNNAPVQISGFSPAGGTWSGVGISPSGLIKPNSSNVGVRNISYSVTQNGCTDIATRGLTIKAAPIISAGPSQTVCGLSGPVLMNGFSPAGGVWSGSGIDASGNFTAVTQNLGNTLTVNYSVSQNGCSTDSSKSIVVVDIPSGVVVNVSALTTCEGQTLPLILSLSNAGNFAIQWKRDNNNIPSATSTDFLASASGSYFAEVKSGSCVVNSESKTLIFNAVPSTPVITINGNSLSSSSATGNQWKFNGQNIPGASNLQYTPTQSGLYTVVVTNASCSSDISAATPFTFTDVKDFEQTAFEIKIYPNPNAGIFNLEVNGLTGRNLDMKMMDVLGKSVWNDNLNGNPDQTFQTEIRLPTLPAGAYWLQLAEGKQKHLRKVILR